MKYMLMDIKKDFIEGDLLGTVLRNRGIGNVEKFLNPDKESYTDFNLVEGLIEARDSIVNHIKNDSKILVLVDSDMDGMASGSIVYRILKEMNPNADVEYYIHETKTHGLTDLFMKMVDKYKFDLIIVSDAGSNDLEQIEKIVLEYKTEVIVIDHHEVENGASPYCITVNNQLDETNKNLTGAGMVYLLARSLEGMYDLNMANIEDLATLGLIGDSAKITEEEVRAICIESLKDVRNNFMKAVYKVKDKDINKLVISDLSFNGVIPLINSVTRVGKLLDRILLFEALADVNPMRKWSVQKRKLNKETRKYQQVVFEMNLYEYAVHICEQAKSTQDKLSKKIRKDVESQIDINSGVKLITIKDKEEYKGLTGLVAGYIANEFEQPAIVVWLDKETGLYRGSMRGYEKTVPNFKEWCESTGLFEYVQGHANASGLSFSKDNYEALKSETYNLDCCEVIYKVDKIFDILTVNDVMKIGENKHLWCKGCEEPIFAIESVVIAKSSIQYSKKTLRIWRGGITYIKFNVSEEEYDDMMSGFEQELTFNFIGKFSINEWNDKKYAQVKLMDYELVEDDGYYSAGAYSIFE